MARLLGSTMARGSAAASPWVRDKLLEFSLSVGIHTINTDLPEGLLLKLCEDKQNLEGSLQVQHNTGVSRKIKTWRPNFWGFPASRSFYLRKGWRWCSDSYWYPAGSYGSALCAPLEMCAVCNSVHSSCTCAVFPLGVKNVEEENINQRVGTIQCDEAGGAVKTEQCVVLYIQTDFWDHGHSSSSVRIPHNRCQTERQLWARGRLHHKFLCFTTLWSLPQQWECSSMFEWTMELIKHPMVVVGNS